MFVAFGSSGRDLDFPTMSAAGEFTQHMLLFYLVRDDRFPLMQFNIQVQSTV